MANENLTAKSIDALASIQDVVSISKNNNGKNAEYVHFSDGKHAVSFWTNTWDSESIEELTSYITCYLVGEVTWEALKNYDTSHAKSEGDDECLRRYVKTSYRLGKEKLATIFDLAVKDCSYSKKLIAKFATFDYEKTSAVLYRGNYVTPYMLEVVANEYMNEHGMKSTKAICKELVNDYLSGKEITI